MNDGAPDLWTRIVAATRHARRVGALRPIETRCEYLQDAEVRFAVRRVVRRGAKPPAAGARDADPFLPYEADLHVADVAPSHVVLLNKYNVFEHHLLIITRDFADQEDWLTLADFEALRVCMGAFAGVGFYNAGTAAGASQPHKHLQVVPLPLAGPAGPAVPIASLLAPPGPIAAVAAGRLPFLHAVTALDPRWVNQTRAGGAVLFHAYCTLLHGLGLTDAAAVGAGRQTGPYNLIVTRNWMLLAPRRRETYHGMTVNALGIAGALLVWDDEQMDMLRTHGPMAALEYVCLPRPTRP
jgi:ATP adenylyltransferase